MTLRAQAERVAEELADKRAAYLAAHGGDGGSYCDDPGCVPCETWRQYAASAPGNHGLAVSAGLDSDPLRQAPQLPWHKRLRLAITKTWGW